jgi:hypothetical protein
MGLSNNPQKLEKWNRWLGDANSDGSIAHELSNLALIKEIHSGLRQMVYDNDNLQKHSAFYSVMQTTYTQSVLMCIRRQVRTDKDSIGLIMLANDISKNCRLITKEFYSDMYAQRRPDDEREEWKRLGERDFAKYFGGKCGDTLDPHLINEDVQKLAEIFAASSGFTDRRLAHLDKREPIDIPMHSEIESWCQTLNSILKKYMLLLRAVDYKFEPVLQHDWKIIFRAAWL